MKKIFNKILTEKDWYIEQVRELNKKVTKLLIVIGVLVGFIISLIVFKYAL